MVNKKAKARRKAAAAAATESEEPGTPTASTSTAPPSPQVGPQTPQPPATPAVPQPETPADPTQEALKHKENGNRLFKEKNYKESVVCYGKAMECDPTQSTYPANRAAAYIQLKQFRNALNDIQRACVLQGEGNEDPKFLARLARCQLALGLVGACSSALDKIVNRNLPSKDPVLVQVASIRDSIRKVQDHLHALAKARAEKNYSMARLALDQLIKSVEAQPEEVLVDWRLEGIRLSILSAKWDQAQVAANECLRLHPQNPEVLVERGRLLFLTGKLAQAETHVTTALRMDPSHRVASELRKRIKTLESTKEAGNALFKQLKFSQALEKYDEALEILGETEEDARGGQIRGTLLSNKATTQLKLDQTQEALDTITLSLELLPCNFKALRTRGRIHIQMAQDPDLSQQESVERYEQGVRDLRMAIEEGEGEADIRALKQELKRAEMDMKRAKTKDYYKILGVKRECTQVEIKKAYRVASLKHHPDKGGDEEQFKLVSEAYAVLSDENRRARYDDGEDEDGLTDGMASGMDFADIFTQFGGGGSGGSFGGGGFGGGGFGGGFHSGAGRGGGPRFTFTTGGSPFGF